MPPMGEIPTIPLNESRSNNQPEYRPTMIAAITIGIATMLRKSAPKRSAGAGFQRMSPHAHDARPCAATATVFACLPKEIDAPAAASPYARRILTAGARRPSVDSRPSSSS